MAMTPNMEETRRLLEELRGRVSGLSGPEALKAEVLDGLTRAMDALTAAGGEQAAGGGAVPVGPGDDPGAERPCCVVASEDYPRLNRTLHARSRSNQAMIFAVDETQYLQEVCRIVVEDCGHAMVWIGYAGQDPDKTVHPVAYSGFEDGYLETLGITWADTERGRGPTGTAIRRGKPCVCANMHQDPQFAPWREEALRRGYASSVVLPLMNEGRAFGAITIYAREPDAFSSEEVALLSELAQDLSFGIQSIRLRQAHAQAEELLRRSEERYRSIVELSPDAIFVNHDGRMAFVNPAGMDLFGAVEPGQILGRSPFDLFDPAYHPEMRRRIETLLDGGSVPLTEARLLRLDGTVRDVEVASSRYDAQEGRALQVVLRDITERKRAEEHLARSLMETRQRAGETEAVLAAMNDAVLVYDTDMNVVRANPGFIPTYGFNPAGLNVRDIMARTRCRRADGIQVPLEQQPTPRALRGETALNQQLRITRPDGTERSLETSATPLRVGDRIVGAVTVWHDVTEREQAAAALARERANLQAVFDVANLGMLLLDGQGTVRRINNTLTRWIGRDLSAGDDLQPGDPVGCLHALTDPAGCGKTEHCGACVTRRAFESALRDGQPVHGVETESILLIDGNTVRMWFEISADPVELDGAPHVLLGVGNITERKRTEEALQREKNRLDAVMAALPVGVAITDARGGSIESNGTYEEIWGAGRPDVATVDDYAAYRAWWADSGRPVLPEEWASARVMEKGEAVVGQLMEIQRFDGTRAFVINSASPVRDAAGNITGSVVALQDITNLRSAQQALRESEERLRLALEAGAMAAWDWQVPTGEVLWNDEHYRMLGYGVGEVKPGYEAWAARLHPDDRPATEAVLRQSMEQGTIYAVQFRVLWPGGETHWVEARGRTEHDGDNGPLRNYGVMLDITERKRAEVALRESEERFRTLFVSMNEGFYLAEVVFDDQGTPCDYRFLEVNPAFEQILGRGRDEIIGRRALELVPNLSAQWMNVFRTVAQTGTPRDYDFYSETFDRHFQTFAFRPAEGQFAVLVEDRTERDRAERALRESEHRFRLALKNAPVSVAVQNCDLVYQWAYNQRTWRPEEMVGRTDADLFAPEEIPQILEVKRRVLATGNEERLALWMTSNGKRRFLDVYFEPLRDDVGAITGIGIAAVDLTDQKRAEEALRKSTERLRLLSEVTSRLLYSDDPQLVVEDLCRGVMRHLDCECFFNFLADPPSGRLRLNACAGIPEEEAQKIAWLDYGVAVCGCVAREGQRIIAEDIQHTHDPRTDLVRTYGIQAYTCHPLLAGARVLGTLSFGSKTRTAFTPDETELMRLVADKVAIGMERILARQALAESEERYRSLFNGMTEGFALHEIVTDEQGQPCDYRFIEANPAFERLTGLKRDDITGRLVSKVLPDNDPAWIEIYGRVALTGEPVHFENYSTPLRRWYDVFAYRPAPRQFAVIFMDITARKEAEEALARRDEGLRQALRLGRSFTFEWTLETDEVVSGEGGAEILGLSAAAAEHDSWANYLSRVHPEDREAFRELLQGLTPENDTYSTAYRVIRPDGAVVCLEEIARAHFDAQGALERVAGIAADVTERMQAQETLRRSHEELERLVDERTAELRELNEALHREMKARQRAKEMALRLAAIVSSSDEAILSKTPDGVILTWNRGAEHLLGYAEADVVGRHVAFLTPDDRPEETEEILERIRRGERIERFESVRLRSDGSRVDVSLTISPIHDAAGQLVAVSEIAHDITERKRMENELRQASEYARSLIEASLDPLATVDQNGIITDVNEATERMTGLPRRQLIGSAFEQYFTESERVLEEFRRVLAEGAKTDLQFAIRHCSGSATDVLLNATVYRNAAGEVQGVFAAARDITERKRAEEELVRYRDHLKELVQRRTAELELAYHQLLEDVVERDRMEAERIRLIDILEATSDMVSYSDASGKVLYFNQAARKVLGIPRDADLADFPIPKGHPDWANKMLEEVALPTAMLEGLWSGETAVLDAEGNEIPVSQVIVAHKDTAGQVAFFSTIARDVSAQKRAEWDLKVLASFPSENPSPVLRTSEKGLLLYANEAAGPLLRDWNCVVGDNVPPHVKKELARAVSRGKIQESEHEAEGRIYSVLFAPVRETGHVNLYGRDVTERKGIEAALVQARDRLEQRVEARTAELLQVNMALVNKIEEHSRTAHALRNSQVRLAEAQRIAHLGGWEWDIRGGSLLWSDEVFRIFGIIPSEQTPSFAEFLNWMPAEDAKRVKETAFRAIAERKPFGLDHRIVRPDGEIRHAHTQAEVVLEDNGAAVRMLGTIMDITERVRAEEEARIREQQLVQADKMVSLGILVAGVAHEINNPNHSIMSNVTALAEVWESTRPILDHFYEDFGDFVLGGFEYSECRDKLPDMFTNALANSKRIEVIVTELRDFARQNPEESMAPFDVNAVVASAIILMTNMVKKSTDHFSTAYGEGLPKVRGNFQRIEQIVINLIQNACQALTSRDGAVRVATAHDPATGMVLIEVCDEGAGIPEENLKQLGTPFFTTKRAGKGMGLGLWISTNIAHEHGGALTFSAREGGGTRARLALPAVEN